MNMEGRKKEVESNKQVAQELKKSNAHIFSIH